MPAFVTFGRVLFAVLFMYTGATKLFAIQPTADFIASKVTIPAMIVPYAAQLESMTGMSTPQLLAVTVGGFEILAGLMIAVNFLTRFFAILLIFFGAFQEPMTLLSVVACIVNSHDLRIAYPAHQAMTMLALK